MKIINQVVLIGAGLFVALNLHAAPLRTSVSTDLTAMMVAVSQTEPSPAEEVPPVGTFYSAQNPGAAPFPFNFKALPAWNLGNGMWLLDDLEADSATPLLAQRSTMSRAMGMGVPMPGDGGGDSGGGDVTNNYTNYTWDTNQLWLAITNVTSDTTFANLHNATNQVYAIWGAADLATPFNSWQVATELWPTDTNCQPFTVSNYAGQNLFLRAEDWTGIDSDGDGIPDWWIWKYFSNLSETATNLDANGNPLLYDYTNSFVPAVFTFTGVEVANNYVSSTPATVQLDVAGNPYYVATLVDDNNFSNAVWNVYSGSTVSVNLGLTEGWHEVWIGLRGHGDDVSAAVWEWKRLKLDFTPPVLVVTGPTNGSVTQPVIQLTGYSPEALASISYDLSNAVVTVTNQPVLTTSQHYDATVGEFTTSEFQGFDIALAGGLNTITVRAMDLAGDTTTLTTNFTLDYFGKPAPTVALIWPQDGLTVCGDTFVCNGQLNDPTANVSAQSVAADGTTNVFSGRVGRDGKFWFENLPLAGGTNHYVLTVTDAVGQVTTGELAVQQGDYGLTINPISIDPMNGNRTTVSGTIAAEGCAITVNGVPAVDNGDDTWQAENVPLPPNASVVTASAQSGSSAPQCVSVVAVNQGIYLSAYTDTFHDHYDFYTNGTSIGTYDEDFSMSWTNGGGGTNLLHWLFTGAPTPWWSPDPNYYEEVYTNTWTGTTLPSCDTGNGGYIATHNAMMGLQHCDSGLHVVSGYTVTNTPVGNVTVTTKEDFKEQGQATLTLATGGEPGSTNVNLWMVDASAMARKFIPSSDSRDDPPPGLTNGPVPFTNIIAGVFGRLDTNGHAFKVLPDNTTVDVTPYVKGEDYYTFNDPSKKITKTVYFSVDPTGKPSSFHASAVQNTLQGQLDAKVFDNLPPLSVRIIVNVEANLGVPSGRNDSYFYNRVTWDLSGGICAARSNPGKIKINVGEIETLDAQFGRNMSAQTWVNIFAHEGIWGNAGGNGDCNPFNPFSTCETGEISAGTLGVPAYLYDPYFVLPSSRTTLRSEFGF